MFTKSFQKIILGSLFLFSSSILPAQVSLRDWIIEDHSGEMKIEVASDTLDITTPKGFTMWYKTRLTGDYEISYHVKFVMEGGENDRLSDLNCFWAANDPQHPDNLYARGAWRNGFFPNYKSLKLFYAGYGGNDNTTTRFREYRSGKSNDDDKIVRPILKEYTDTEHLLKPDKWFHIVIRVHEGITTYSINGEELFRYPLKKKQGDGNFGLRLLKKHILFAGFRAKAL